MTLFTTYSQFLVLFSAQFTKIIDYPVIASPHIFFIFAMVDPVHSAICIIRIAKQPFYYILDSNVTGWIAVLNFSKPLCEVNGGIIKEFCHDTQTAEFLFCPRPCIPNFLPD
jgi:hypothetical protein